MSYRTDPEWLAARADYYAEDDELSINERIEKRRSAIRKMYEIEKRYPLNERYQS